MQAECKFFFHATLKEGETGQGTWPKEKNPGDVIKKSKTLWEERREDIWDYSSLA
jgi:hypothetical protein